MISAFCPGHITCFFHPVKTDSIFTTGSRGVGIKLSKGTNVIFEERLDNKIVITMNGKHSDCKIVELAIRNIISDEGFDVTVDNDFPIGQGFGMSASSAIAAALCACEYSGKDKKEAYKSAHIADIKGGGGLGDVSGIMCNSHFPVRKRAGIPPYGEVVDLNLKEMSISIAVLDNPLHTKDIIADFQLSEKLVDIGSRCVDSFIKNPSKDSLFHLSNKFSNSTGLETTKVNSAIRKVSKTGNAGMCMLGHSIFTDLDGDELSTLIDDALIIQCISANSMPKITHKG
ncbi:MAG: pantothenate kinase [archaeon]|nr:pantothenate kinase [archaeon]